MPSKIQIEKTILEELTSSKRRQFSLRSYAIPLKPSVNKEGVNIAHFTNPLYDIPFHSLKGVIIKLINAGYTTCDNEKELEESYEYIREGTDNQIYISITKAGEEYLKQIQLNPDYEDDPVKFILTINEKREISVNEGNKRFVVGKCDFDSQPELIIEYLIKNPDKIITKEHLENILKIKFTRKFSNIIKDIGFKHELKKIFFPGISKDSILLKNPIKEQYYKRNNFTWRIS